LGIAICDATTGLPIGQSVKHGNFIKSAAFNKCETQILTWRADGTAKLWDATDGSPIGQPMKHDEEVEGAVFNKDATRIAMKKHTRFVKYNALNGGVVFGVVFPKKCSQIGKKPPQNRLQIFSLFSLLG